MKWVPLAIAFLLSFLWIIAIPNTPVSDQIIYDYTARTIAEGRGYLDHSGHPTAFWAPGYSFYLAFFYWLLGPSYFAGFAANFISYMALVLGIYYLGKALYDATTGFLAAVFAAFYPTFIFYNTILASEILFSTLVIWSLFCLWKSFCGPDHKDWPWIIPGGVLLGLAALTRSQSLILPLMVFVIGYVKKSPWRKTLVRFFMAGLLMVLLCLPWGLRNQHQFGKFVLISANFGVNLWTGNHEGATGEYVDLDKLSTDRKLIEGNVVERDEVFKQKALDYIASHPWQFIWLSIKRFFLSLRSESIAVVWNQMGIEKIGGKSWMLPLKIVANAGWYLLLLGVFWGIFFHIRRKVFHTQDWVLIMSALFLSTAFVFFHIQDRYHLPLIPYMLLFFSHSMVEQAQPNLSLASWEL